MRLAIMLLLLASACHGPKEHKAGGLGNDTDPALSPVTDAKAPTVKELLAAGYLIVDGREIGCDAGPGVACDAFDAAYLGKQGVIGKREVAEFACPGTEAPPDDWKCRKLDPPYVPNGGFRPVVGNGS